MAVAAEVVEDYEMEGPDQMSEGRVGMIVDAKGEAKMEWEAYQANGRRDPDDKGATQ